MNQNEHSKKLPVLLAIFAILLNLSFLSCKDDEGPEDTTIEVPDEGVVEKAAFVDIPDPNFRAYLKKTIPKAFPNGGNKIDPQHSMVKGLTILDVKDKGIKSLSGIQYFISLEELYCSNNVLDTLDLTGNTALTWLDCSETQLRELTLPHNTALVYISCGDNQLKHLDVSQNKALKELVCSHNQLTALNLKNNTALTSLTCPANQLKELNLTQNKSLNHLNCWGNQIKNLDLSQNIELTLLFSWDQSLENLDLRGIYPSEGKKNPYVWIIDQEESHRKYDKSITVLKTIKINDAFKNVSNSFHDQLSYIKEKNPKVVISSYDKQGNPILEDYDPLASSKLEGVKKSESAQKEVKRVDIPDENFRAYLKEIVPKAFPEGGEQLDANHLIVRQLEKINVNKKGIKTLEGIEYFTGLKTLFCTGNQLTSLDVSQNTALTSLYCYKNQLNRLNIKGSKALTGLWCNNNQLTSLDVNQNTALTKLSCHDNQLQRLDVSENTALTNLSCKENQLTHLDLSNNKNLKYLDVRQEKLKELTICASVMTSIVHTDLSNLPSSVTIIKRDCSEQSRTDINTLFNIKK